jgi:Uma2 family endonuclease
MRAVWLEPDESFLEERHRRGLDKLDEVWDGVLHMVPPFSFLHGDFTERLEAALRPIAARRGLVVHGDGFGLFDHPKNYRIPDATLSRPDQASERGLESAELVVEILSKDDESRDKLPFYAARGVREVWLIEPATCATEIFTLARKKYTVVRFVRGRARSPLLGITLEIAHSKLRLRDGDAGYDV